MLADSIFLFLKKYYYLLLIYIFWGETLLAKTGNRIKIQLCLLLHFLLVEIISKLIFNFMIHNRIFFCILYAFKINCNFCRFVILINIKFKHLFIFGFLLWRLIFKFLKWICWIILLTNLFIRRKFTDYRYEK